jgi:hypothetical protein
MEGEPAGQDGVAGTYRDRRLADLKLYDLTADLGERDDVSAKYPEVVRRLEAEDGKGAR